MVMPRAPDGWLADGDPVESTSGWQVISAPGHTDDSTCLFHSTSATLFSGDAVLTVDGHAWFNPEVTHRGSAAGTEDRLRELSVEHLYPGHGRPIHGADLMRTARSFRDPDPSPGLMAGCARRLGNWR